MITFEQQNAKLATKCIPAMQAALGKWYRVKLQTGSIVQGNITACEIGRINNRYTRKGTQVAEAIFKLTLDNGVQQHTVHVKAIPQ